MTPQDFAKEVAMIRAERGRSIAWDTPIKTAFMRNHPELSEVEFNNLVSVAHQKDLI